jgi:hypothetical protein
MTASHVSNFGLTPQRWHNVFDSLAFASRFSNDSYELRKYHHAPEPSCLDANLDRFTGVWPEFLAVSIWRIQGVLAGYRQNIDKIASGQYFANPGCFGGILTRYWPNTRLLFFSHHTSCSTFYKLHTKSNHIRAKLLKSEVKLSMGTPRVKHCP